MAVAERYQVPRSILLGRPMPRPGEPLWLPDDREWAIVYEQFKRGVCTRCGTRHEEWADDPDAYVAVPTRCPGAEALAISDEQIPEQERARGAFSVLIRGDEWDAREDIKDAASRLGLRRARWAD
jgi:hypothetical protein